MVVGIDRFEAYEESNRTESVAEAVSDYTQDGISIYDTEFVREYERSGEEFLVPYLADVATYMGNRIVRAFELHDGDVDRDGGAEDDPHYSACAKAFADVYQRLYPISEHVAKEAGFGEARALRYHDRIEDSIDTLRRSSIDDGEDLDEAEQAYSVDEILDHDRWGIDIQGPPGRGPYEQGTVAEAFWTVSLSLGLPPEHTAHKTNFYRFHTALNESDDLPVSDGYRSYLKESYPMRSLVADPLQAGNALTIVGRSLEWMNRSRQAKELEDATAMHASKAVMMEFERFFDEPEVLETVAETYLNAVRSHDAHTREDQLANRERMTALYLTALTQKVDDLYDVSQESKEQLGRAVAITEMEDVYDRLFL